MNLFAPTNHAPGVELLRRHADQVRDGKAFDDAASEMYADLDGQLTRSEVEALLLTEVAGIGPGDGWCHHPAIGTMEKLLAARV